MKIIPIWSPFAFDKNNPLIILWLIIITLSLVLVKLYLDKLLGKNNHLNWFRTILAVPSVFIISWYILSLIINFLK